MGLDSPNQGHVLFRISLLEKFQSQDLEGQEQLLWREAQPVSDTASQWREDRFSVSASFSSASSG